MCCTPLDLYRPELKLRLREKDGLYEYNAVYVNDLLIQTRDPGSTSKDLSEKH
jgi:hypothetical protein